MLDAFFGNFYWNIKKAISPYCIIRRVAYAEYSVQFFMGYMGLSSHCLIFIRFSSTALFLSPLFHFLSDFGLKVGNLWKNGNFLQFLRFYIDILLVNSKYQWLLLFYQIIRLKMGRKKQKLAFFEKFRGFCLKFDFFLLIFSRFDA